MITQGISILTIFILIFIVFDFILEFFLDKLNSKSWDLPIPQELEGIYDKEKYEKARQYHHAKEQLSNIATILSTTITVLFLWLKGFAYAHDWVASITASPIWQALLFDRLFLWTKI